MRQLMVLALAFGVWFGVGGTVFADEPLQIAVDDWEPYSFMRNHQASGTDIDLLKAAAERMDLAVINQASFRVRCRQDPTLLTKT